MKMFNCWLSTLCVILAGSAWKGRFHAHQSMTSLL